MIIIVQYREKGWGEKKGGKEKRVRKPR